MKRKSALLIVLMMLASFTAGAENLRGDVDQDGRVNIADVTALIDYLLTNDATGISLANADSDLDGRVNIADVTALIDYLLTGAWEEPVTPSIEGDWVDLGLPSGTIWATRNVGANSPEDYGDYFSWGETEPKDYYDWANYKWNQGGYYDELHIWTEGGITKYCNISDVGYNGFVDNKTELDPSDDAACAHYPGGRMPSSEQVEELLNSCFWMWTTLNGVNGHLVTGPNGKSIFLPAAGDRWYDYLSGGGTYGLYWSRTLDCNDPRYSYNLEFFNRSTGYLTNLYREQGLTVRAVHAP